MKPVIRQIPQIQILKKGPGWLALDKPGGMSVHNHPGNDLVSVISKQIQSDPALSQALGFKTASGVHPVHRLDKETGGVILLATDPDALAFLSGQFRENRVAKEYIALVHGRVDSGQTELGQTKLGQTNPGPADRGYGTWNTPLAKSAGGRNHPTGSGKKLACETRYRCLEASEHYSLLAIDLVTGRKHQIRRHAKLAGHPIVGDSRYGSKRALAFLKTKRDFHGLALHCRSIRLVLPKDTAPTRIRSGNGLSRIFRLFEADKLNQCHK